MVTKVYANFAYIRHHFIDEIYFTLSICDTRNLLFISYLHQIENCNVFTEKEKKQITETLTIKDFITTGNFKFHEKMKVIEKNIKSNSFKYLNINSIENHLEEKKNNPNDDIRTYFYFIIIKLEEFNENFDMLFLLSKKTGITFLFFLYVENEHETKICKNQLNLPIPSIIVYSTGDILCIYLKN